MKAEAESLETAEDNPAKKSELAGNDYGMT